MAVCTWCVIPVVSTALRIVPASKGLNWNAASALPSPVVSVPTTVMKEPSVRPVELKNPVSAR